ncbi:MAG: DUF1330 domain-containing protein [Candidatus Promineifilaceae bacterium]
MSAYLIALIDVNDMEQYRKYMALSPGIIAKYGGKFLTRGGRSEVVEGDADPRRKVLVEFPDYEAAHACYYSAEYQAAKAVRESAAVGTFILLEGV